MSRSLPLMRRALAGLALFVAGGVAHGASFGVTPVRAELDVAHPIASFVVRNREDAPTVVQVDVAAWRQQDGADVLEPTEALIATPPIATIPPGGEQIVRIGLRRPAAGGATEQSYRVLLQEVPPPPPSGFQGMRMALRMSIPVFVPPASRKAPRLAWRARASDGALVLSLANAGNAHAQVATLDVTGADGKPLNATPLSGYVLPGQRREWRLPAVTTPTSVHLRGRTTTGAIDETVVPASG